MVMKKWGAPDGYLLHPVPDDGCLGRPEPGPKLEVEVNKANFMASNIIYLIPLGSSP